MIKSYNYFDFIKILKIVYDFYSYDSFYYSTVLDYYVDNQHDNFDDLRYNELLHIIYENFHDMLYDYDDNNKINIIYL